MGSPKIKYILSTLSLVFITTCAFAQFDTIAKRMQHEFDTFKKGIEQEHRQFRSRNDSIFSALLKNPWQSYDVFYEPKPVEKPKPARQPVVPGTKSIPQIPEPLKTKDSTGTNSAHDTSAVLIRVHEPEPPREFEKLGFASVPVEFYGTPIALTIPTGFPSVTEISEKGILRFFNEATTSFQINRVFEQLSGLKKSLLLNDWGYYKLTETMSRKISELPHEQVVLSWFLLLKSGYNVKVGYAGKRIFLLFPSFERISDTYYVINGKDRLYIIADKNEILTDIKIVAYPDNYPESIPFSLKIKFLPELDKKIVSKAFSFEGQTFRVWQNLNLISFYRDYPACDMEVYFSAPVSEIVICSLDSLFNPRLSGLDNRKKVDLLLAFMQNSFAYKTDKEQFAREKYMFPDELFYYPFSDCEDRAVLFSRLIRHFTGLQCVGLEYEKHVNTAIFLPWETHGEKITVAGRQFTVCDPTYMNASPGYLANEYKDMTPLIITFQ